MELNRGRIGLLAGMGIGATLMYFLDSKGGGRRRALARDKSIKYSKKTGRAVEGKALDMRNRAKGAVAETRGALREMSDGDGELRSRPSPAGMR